jgi:hypothetical protein
MIPKLNVRDWSLASFYPDKQVLSLSVGMSQRWRARTSHLCHAFHARRYHAASQGDLDLSDDFSCACRKIKSEHIRDVGRREWGGKEYALPARRRAKPAHPSPGTDACGPHCSISCTTAVGDVGGARRTQQRGQGTPVGSNRSAVRHIRFAMGSVAMSAGRECPLIEVFG